MAIKKVAKTADAARKGAMTKTVVKKVSPNVKIIKAGSKPLTQSLTEKRAIMEKAKGKTPAARAKAASEKKSATRAKTREQGRMRQSIMNTTFKEALKAAGYDANQRFSPTAAPATPAQIKAANKAVAAAEKKMAEGKRAAKAADKAKRGQSNKGGKSSRGGARTGGGISGPLGGFGGGGVGGPFGKMD
jgi:uncharacterized membrane protein YgcG